MTTSVEQDSELKIPKEGSPDALLSSIQLSILRSNVVRYSRSSLDTGTTAQASLAVQEEPLICAAQAGCPSAFAELCNQHSQRVYRTAFTITKNREDAEDVLQESFLKAYLALKGFESRASFSTWLTRIAINCSLMTLRRRRTRPQVSISFTSESGDLDGAPIDFKDMSPNPEQLCAQRQQYSKLLRAIDKLAPNLRAVAEVRILQECTVSETAQLLDISEAAAKSRTLRARTRLTSKLASGSPFLSK